MSNVNKIQSKMEKDLKTGFLSLMILLVISKSEEPSYGYRIIKSITDLSDGRMSITEGTMYVLLKSHHNQNLVTSYWGPSTKGGPPRRYYEITSLGNHILRTGLDEWRKLIDIQEQLSMKLEGG